MKSQIVPKAASPKILIANDSHLDDAPPLMSFPFNRKSGLPLMHMRLITLWEMHKYAADLLIHVCSQLSDLKENAVHHREQKHIAEPIRWPDIERQTCSERLRATFPWLDELDLKTTKHQMDQLAQVIMNCPPDCALVLANSVRSVLELELKSRKFFALSPDHDRFYNSDDLAGEDFKAGCPLANADLKESGNCLALGRYTAAMFHFCRALERSLILLERDLGIVVPPAGGEKTWGKRLGRIKDEFDKRNKTPPPNWNAEREFYEGAKYYFSIAKDYIRDDTVHVEKNYNEAEALSLFTSGREFLRHVSKKLKE